MQSCVAFSSITTFALLADFSTFLLSQLSFEMRSSMSPSNKWQLANVASTSRCAEIGN